MASKRNKPKPSAGASATKQIKQAMVDGYVAFPAHHFFGGKANADTPGWSDVLNVVIHGDSKKAASKSGDIFASVGNEQTGYDAIGTPGKGWMEWGAGNRLPNIIALLTSLLPYTAAGIKFNTDTAAGLGPKPKYRHSYYSNGSLQTEEVDYANAGLLIEGQILSLQLALSQHYAACKEKGIELPKRQKENIEEREDEQSFGMNTPKDSFSSDAEIRVNQQIEDRLLKQIADAEEAYAIWEQTSKDVSDFTKKNNLDLILLKLFGDMCSLGICFPEIQLSQDPLTKDSRVWKPKATGMDYRSSLTCRLERMDDDNRINYVYVSNRWQDDKLVDTKEDLTMSAIRALDPTHPLNTLDGDVRKARLRKTKIADRPTRFILPSYYPTLGRPYYPQPSWWSIFGGDIYNYASTIISDRATRKKNSNSFGRIIYVHLDYLNKLYQQERCNTSAERGAIRDQIFDEINTFLNDRGNSGQSLLSFSFTGADGKQHDAYRIVEIPYNSKGTADANKTELEEVASIIFFALEIHPDLIGAVPGRSGSSGGTYQREMYLLKQLQMAPTQNIVLKALEVISQFNEWDSHLVWRVKQMTLTTLDRNKNGMEETKV